MIVVIGYKGIVGNAVYTTFSQHHEVLGIDKDTDLSVYDTLHGADIFVCVPTPTVKKSVDVSIVEAVISRIPDGNTIIIKSTVPPGTHKKLSTQYPHKEFVSSPEFLTEANPLYTFTHQDRVVIGTENEDTFKRIAHMYISSILVEKIIQVRPIEAELVKYLSNAFLALKVLYANEAHAICSQIGADWDYVKKCVGSDMRIGMSHLDVTQEGGFGGMCFPKDTQGFATWLKEKDIKTEIFSRIPTINRKYRT